MISDLHQARSGREMAASKARPVLLHLYGHADEKSRQMKPILSEVAAVFGGCLDVKAFEVGECRNLAGIYQVGDELPQLVLVVDGRQRGRLTGLRRRREIAAFLLRHVGLDAETRSTSEDGLRLEPVSTSRNAA